MAWYRPAGGTLQRDPGPIACDDCGKVKPTRMITCDRSAQFGDSEGIDLCLDCEKKRDEAEEAAKVACHQCGTKFDPLKLESSLDLPDRNPKYDTSEGAEEHKLCKECFINLGGDPIEDDDEAKEDEGWDDEDDDGWDDEWDDEEEEDESPKKS